MCSRYQLPLFIELTGEFGELPPTWIYPNECYPGQDAPILVKNAKGDLEPMRACFGMLPHWAKGEKLARQTYNARSETVAEKPSFRNAWKKRQFCLIPAKAFYEPCYETGKAVWTRIARKDDKPFAIAGIWESRKGEEEDRPRRSFSMLTISGEGHPIMQRMHSPGDEKRSVVVLEENDYDRWLEGKVEDDIRDMLKLYDAEQFLTTDAPKREPKVVQ